MIQQLMWKLALIKAALINNKYKCLFIDDESYDYLYVNNVTCSDEPTVGNAPTPKLPLARQSFVVCSVFWFCCPVLVFFGCSMQLLSVRKL